MVSTFTTNKYIEKPGNNDYVNTWNVPVNADWDIIDKAMGGTTSLSVTSASGTVVLTTAEYQALILNITGVLTANVAYQVPSTVGGQWMVKNATTGAFTLTISSGGAGTSVVLAQGYNTIVVSDGTNITSAINTTATAAGSTTQVQYNSAGVLAGSASFVFDGTNVGIGTSAPAYPLHVTGATQLVQSYVATTGANVNVATTAASGTGTTATLTFTTTYTAPVGSTVIVAGVTPAGYNGTYVVTSSTVNTISFANATTGAQTVAGTITFVYEAGVRIAAPNHQYAITTDNSSQALRVYDVTSAAERIRVGSSGQIGIGGANYGTSGQVLTSAGSSAAPSWAAVNTTAIQGAFKNLKVTANAGAATTAVTADQIMLEDASNTYIVARTVNLTISSGTSGVNGLDTGTVAASTWYSVWVIYNGTTTAGLMSLSATAPTLPSGYTYKARVGWVRTSATAAQNRGSIQYGRRAQYVVDGTVLTQMPTLASGTTSSAWVAQPWANFAPSTAGGLILALSSTTGTSSYGAVAPNGNYPDPSTPSAAPLVLRSNNAFSTIQGTIVPESANIYYWASLASYAVYAFGWEDNL